MLNWYVFAVGTALATQQAMVSGLCQARLERIRKQRKAAAHGYIIGRHDSPNGRPARRAYPTADLQYCFDHGRKVGAQRRADSLDKLAA